jgi:hypothetical protein
VRASAANGDGQRASRRRQSVRRRGEAGLRWPLPRQPSRGAPYGCRDSHGSRRTPMACRALPPGPRRSGGGRRSRLISASLHSFRRDEPWSGPAADAGSRTYSCGDRDDRVSIIADDDPAEVAHERLADVGTVSSHPSYHRWGDHPSTPERPSLTVRPGLSSVRGEGGPRHQLFQLPGGRSRPRRRTVQWDSPSTSQAAHSQG